MNKDIFYGLLVKGDLVGAIKYLKQFPEEAELCRRYERVFEQEQYITYPADDYLNGILKIYQRYFKDVFYMSVEKERAEENLRARLSRFLGIKDDNIELSDIEQNQIAEAFQSRGFHFLGGRTNGFYGPYVWETVENRTYDVELPDGVQSYTVKLLDGFIIRSWIDYISFDEICPGGWTDSDGVINCVKSTYDFDSENFKVSLLKHEAQHARDLAVNGNMPLEDLEYRAKLVELIYSSERNLLKRFIQEADGADKSNGHSAAANKIINGFSKKLSKDKEELCSLPVNLIQSTAKQLFFESSLKVSKEAN